MAGTTLLFNLAANLEGHTVNGWYVERKIPTKGPLEVIFPLAMKSGTVLVPEDF